MQRITEHKMETSTLVEYILGAVGESGNVLYRDYIGIIFPYSLLSTSKFEVPAGIKAALGWQHPRDLAADMGVCNRFSCSCSALEISYVFSPEQ